MNEIERQRAKKQDACVNGRCRLSVAKQKPNPSKQKVDYSSRWRFSFFLRCLQSFQASFCKHKKNLHTDLGESSKCHSFEYQSQHISLTFLHYICAFSRRLRFPFEMLITWMSLQSGQFENWALNETKKECERRLNARENVKSEEAEIYLRHFFQHMVTSSFLVKFSPTKHSKLKVFFSVSVCWCTNNKHTSVDFTSDTAKRLWKHEQNLCNDIILLYLYLYQHVCVCGSWTNLRIKYRLLPHAILYT